MDTPAAAAHEAHAAHPRESFIRHYIFSLDHKMIGKQYYFVTLFMAIVGGSLALLMRAHLASPERGILDPGTYLQAATMHGTVMIFFFLTTILTGAFGNVLIPLMIGAADMAFPFLNMLSFWTFFPSVLILLASFFVPGGHHLLRPRRPAGRRPDRPPQRGRGAALAAPLLVLRAPRSVHPHPRSHGDRVGRPLDLLTETHLRVYGDGPLARRDRVPELPRLGAPHVRQRHEPGARGDVHDLHDDHRHPVGDQDVQLADAPVD